MFSLYLLGFSLTLHAYPQVGKEVRFLSWGQTLTYGLRLANVLTIYFYYLLNKVNISKMKKGIERKVVITLPNGKKTTKTVFFCGIIVTGSVTDLSEGVVNVLWNATPKKRKKK